MKRVLIISPYFVPANTADMQRIRMSLHYFESVGWQPELVVVNDKYVDAIKDPLLLKSIPKDIKIHQVKALAKTWTSKFGLGSLALRSLPYYRNKVNDILTKERFDLIYFSTTEFPLCILGAYWKKKFGAPYVIDMQDPWHTDYYRNKPKEQRPNKYWFSYRLHKYLEPIAMKSVDGLISVSLNYIETLQERYPKLVTKPSAVITFGAFDLDFEIAKENDANLELPFDPNNKTTNLVYIGRGGHDMSQALRCIFITFNKGLKEKPELFEKIHIHFIGTSYAPNGTGTPTISPLADEFQLNLKITEYTNRIGFYQSLKSLQNADGLIIIGSDQPAYTASKLFQYILAKRPLLAVLHDNSSATKILNDCKAGFVLAITDPVDSNYNKMCSYLESIKSDTPPSTNWQAFECFTAEYLTKKQVQLFNEVVKNYDSKTV